MLAQCPRRPAPKAAYKFLNAALRNRIKTGNMILSPFEGKDPLVFVAERLI
jgi:hypothetical protein